MTRTIDFEFLGEEYTARVDVRYRTVMVSQNFSDEELDEIVIDWVADENGNYVDVTDELQEVIENIVVNEGWG